MDLPLDQPGGSPAGNPAAARTPTVLADGQAPLRAVDAWWAIFSPRSGFEPQALAFTIVALAGHEEMQESNLRQSDFGSDALPTELNSRRGG